MPATRGPMPSAAVRRPAAPVFLLLILLVAAAALMAGLAGCRPPAPPPVSSENQGSIPATAPSGPAGGQPAGTQTPAPPAPTAQRPAIVLARVLLTEIEGENGWVAGEIALEAGDETVVGTDRFTLLVRLDPVPLETWYAAHVKLAGGDPQPLRQDLFPYGMIEVSYPKGPAGERITITLDSVVAPSGGGMQPVTYALTRAPEPRAELLAWTGDRWRQVQPGEVLEARPLRIGLRFSKAMDQLETEAILKEQLPNGSGWTWTAGGTQETLTWELATPPPVVDLQLDQIRSADGLWLAGACPAVYTGSPPRLEFWDPATQRAELGPRVMPDIHAAQMDAASGVLLFSAFRRYAGLRYPAETEWLLAPGDPEPCDLEAGWRYVGLSGSGQAGFGAEGSCCLVRIHDLEYQVLGPQNRVVVGGTLPADLRWAMLSPDGLHLAGLVTLWELEDESTYLVPHDLAIVELATGTTQWFRSFVSVFLPPTEWWVSARSVWSPDGGRIAAVSDLAAGFSIEVADRTSGGSSRAVSFAGIGLGTTEWFTWEPSGGRWLLGDALIPAEAPRDLARLPVHGRSFWSPDGRWLAYGYDWQDVGLLDVQSGETLELGPGLICGWDPQNRLCVIRWEDAAYRYMHEGM